VYSLYGEEICAVFGITERKANFLGAARCRSTLFISAKSILKVESRPTWAAFSISFAFRSIAVLSLSAYVYTPSGREAPISARNLRRSCGVYSRCGVKICASFGITEPDVKRLNAFAFSLFVMCPHGGHDARALRE
jgi:hypothetical protein